MTRFRSQTQGTHSLSCLQEPHNVASDSDNITVLVRAILSTDHAKLVGLHFLDTYVSSNDIARKDWGWEPQFVVSERDVGKRQSILDLV